VKAGIERTFGSLRTRNFRLFFSSELVSFTGEWMQNMAEAWLVLQMTRNGAAVGAVFAFRFLPVLLFGLWGGVIADRLDRRNIMVFTQSIAAVLAFALWGIVQLDIAEVWMIYGLAIALGLVVVIDHPAHNAFVEEMVGPEQMPNAVALNSAALNSARITGPAIAALLISQFGVSWVFFVNGVSFIAVVGALLAMRRSELLPIHREAERPRIADGLRFAWSVREMRGTILLLGIVGTLVWNFPTFLTLLAENTFHGEAGLAGILMAILGVGTVIGALGAAHQARTSARIVVGAAIALGASMLATAAAPNRAIVMATLIPTGALAVLFGAVANSHMQSLSTREFRGRVMSIYSILGLGTTVLGGPLVGWISQQWSPRVAIAVAGVATSVAALALSLRSSTRSRPRVTTPYASLALDGGDQLWAGQRTGEGLHGGAGAPGPLP
jgi:MFS family permease